MREQAAYLEIKRDTMPIDTEVFKTLFNLSLNLAKETAIKAHNYLGSHSRIKGYCKYPTRYIIFPKDNPKYFRLYKEIPYLIYDIPKYELRDLPEDRVQYGAIFNGYNSDCINITSLDGYSELFDYINQSLDLKKLMLEEDKPSNLEYKIKSIILGAVERYLYSIKASQDIPDNLEEKLRPVVAEKLLRYISPQLNINIYIPICLATFEDDNIILSDQVEIIRIPDDIQKSRQQVCTYEIDNEDWLAACATHMIVLHNYCFKNDEYISINTVTQNYHAYPLQVIDEIMSIIRTVTGYTIGYEQILCCPLNWIDEFCADLTPLYGAKSHFVNAKEINKMWMKLPVNKINSEQALEIKKLYGVVLSSEGDKSKGNLVFALKRLNRCMLRDEDDDMAIDATIGLEALLSGGAKAEITYTISNRIPVVFAHEHNGIYTPKNCRAIMKKIYNFRSKIVHGDTIKGKDKYYELNGSRVAIEKIAVDFLRYTLLFVLHNPKYLDAKKFDEFIDYTVFGERLQ